jgi:hypothetical protein
MLERAPTQSSTGRPRPPAPPTTRSASSPDSPPAPISAETRMQARRRGDSLRRVGSRVGCPSLAAGLGGFTHRVTRFKAWMGAKGRSAAVIGAGVIGLVLMVIARGVITLL